MEGTNIQHLIRMISFGFVVSFFAMSFSGCSGIRVQESISPSTILLPGLLGEQAAPTQEPLVARHSR